MKTENKTSRPIYMIAYEITENWKKPYFGAVPYLRAMRVLNTINDRFEFDDARSIITYFLSNATTWRGEIARRVKKELNEMIKH